jgi:hypothetical protein
MAGVSPLFGFSRRHFIASTLSTLGAGLVAPGCSLESPPSTPAGPIATHFSPANGSSTAVGPSNSIDVDVRLPGALVFPRRLPTPGLVQITAVRKDAEHATVTVLDSDGRAVTFDASASFAGGIQRQTKARREHIAPKVLAAYTLDTTWQKLRRERLTRASAAWGTALGDPADLLRELEALSRLRRDFARLQEQAVVDNVSTGALVVFLESIAQRRAALSQVVWDPLEKRIVASFG